eukprot:scaffold1322_cov372-Pavlova_lutheri.AAC.1
MGMDGHVTNAIGNARAEGEGELALSNLTKEERTTTRKQRASRKGHRPNPFRTNANPSVHGRRDT